MIASTRLKPIGEVTEVNAGGMHRADPRLKQTALLGVGTTVLLGSVALWVLHRWLGQQGRAEQAFDVILLGFLGLGVLIAGGLLILAWSLWQEASLVKREGRYPPANMRTLRDVPIVQGAAAQRAARHLVWGAIGLGAGAALLVWELWSTIRIAIP